MKHLSLLLALVACCLAAAPALADEGTFDSGGVPIRYVVEGKGEPVVLIHGWMGSSASWGSDPAGNTKLDTTRAEGFKLIALDCRGHGKSSKPHDVAAYGPAMAEDVVRLLDHLKIDKAHLVGYSMGAFIAGHVAAHHPDRVLSVVFGGQAPIVTDGAPSNIAPEVEAFAQAADAGDMGAFILAVTPPGRPRPTTQQATAIAAFAFHNKDVKALAAAGRGFKDLHVTPEQLRRCSAPVLFIHGANEAEPVKAAVAAVHEMLGRGEVKTIDGADHQTTPGRPEFGEAILAFLRAAPCPEAAAD